MESDAASEHKHDGTEVESSLWSIIGSANLAVCDVCAFYGPESSHETCSEDPPPIPSDVVWVMILPCMPGFLQAVLPASATHSAASILLLCSLFATTSKVYIKWLMDPDEYCSVK